MPVIKDVLDEEYERLHRMERNYINKIKELPKGSIVKRNIKGKVYYYLAYRDASGKVHQDYLKLKIEEIDDLRKKIDQRRKLEKVLREIKKDYILIKKVLKK